MKRNLKGSFTDRILTGGLASTSAIALMVSASTAAYAQDTDSPNTDSQAANSVAFEEIVVTGVRASIISARNLKRDAVGVSDAISAEDLGKFPDLNLSETLQRIPGVTLNRSDTGQGSTINLRGLGANFTRVQINGMTAPSTNAAGGRGFDFEILPSELFTTVVVNKSVSARHAEGGLAGLVEMSTPQPFSYPGFKLAASAQGNLSKTADNLGGRGSLLVSNNFNDEFGIAAAVVYARGKSQSNRSGGFNVRPFGLTAIKDDDGNPAIGTAEEQAAYVNNIPHYIWNISDTESVSGNLAVQWRPSDDIEVSLNGLYSTLDATRFTTRFDAPNESNVTSIENAVVENGVITSGTFGGVQQRVGANNLSRDDELYQVIGSVKWTPTDDWTITPYMGYTKRSSDGLGALLSYRRADLDTGEFVLGDVSYTHQGKHVDWSTSGTDFSANPEEFLINVFYLTPTESRDSDFTTKLDFEHTFHDSPLKAIDFGARYSVRKMVNVNHGGVIVRADTGVDRRTLPSLADNVYLIENFNISGAPAGIPETLNTADIDKAIALWLPNGLDGAAIDGAAVTDRALNGRQNSYDLREATFNAYAEATFEVDRLLFNAGLRFLRTEQTTNGTSVTNGVPSAVNNVRTYHDFLPSASLRYEVQDDLYIRAAYSRSYTRPTLSDLAPTENISGVDEGGGFGSQGNPGLQPFTANNIDLGLEWYFGDEGLLSATLFYKSLDGIIDTETFTEDRTFPRQRDGVLVTAPVVITRPANGASAEIKGLEVAGQMRLTFLPEGWMQNFGVQANYTFADSSADFNAEDDVRSTGLPGLSRHSANASLYYDDQRFNARLAYAWRSEYLHAFAGAWGIPRFQNAFGQLDFSANYEVISNVHLQLQVLNVTNNVVSFTSDAVKAPNNVTQLDRRILFGARVSF